MASINGRRHKTNRGKKSRKTLWKTQCACAARNAKREAAAKGKSHVEAAVEAAAEVEAKAKVAVFVIACLRSASSTANNNDMRLSNVSAINREDRQRLETWRRRRRPIGLAGRRSRLERTYV